MTLCLIVSPAHQYFVSKVYYHNPFLRYPLNTIKSPLWLVMTVFARFEWARTLAKFIARTCEKSSLKKLIHQEPLDPLAEPAFVEPAKFSLFRDVDVSQAVSKLRKDGLFLGLRLPCTVVQNITEFAAQTDFYADGYPQLGFKKKDREKVAGLIGKDFRIAQTYNSRQRCPDINRIVQDPLLIEIAREYVGSTPVFIGCRLWWLFANAEYSADDIRKTAGFFHYDLDDYSCLRFFFYLSDVDSQGGPHICVRGSHRNKRLHQLLRLTKRFDKREILNCYKKDDIVTVTGEAGFGFAEDTICYHKAEPPIGQDRLMLEVKFASRDYNVSHDTVNASKLKNVLAG